MPTSFNRLSSSWQYGNLNLHLYIYILYFVLACGGYYTSSSGSFTSPGFPNNYPNNAKCNYEIRAPADRRIVLELQFYELEFCCDSLIIREILSGSINLVAEVTATRNTPIRYISERNVFILAFTSDRSVTGRGFRATYYTFGAGR